MKIVTLISLIVLLLSCTKSKVKNEPKKIIWENRITQLPSADSLEFGRSYLSVYSEIYDISSHQTTHLLTATVSIRNVNLQDPIYIIGADYYNTKGELIRSYIKNPVLFLQWKL
mgnify:CR=1 FL=1|nr:DUF3124 domain-containing protein [uncultured Draconibacterium sp.]